MESYQSWFTNPELLVLRMLGLFFDRPADARVLEAVMKRRRLSPVSQNHCLI